MNIYVGVTDKEWYKQLQSQQSDEVNFWNPGGKVFRALRENELFLFKLHYPDNFIVGGAFFVRFSLLPPFLAWQAFGIKNGTTSYDELLKRIQKYRSRNRIDASSQIGCCILTEPFWFAEEDWITPPEWGRSIVQGKVYSTETAAGQRLFAQIQERIPRSTHSPAVLDTQQPRYADSMTKHRLGQGGFRIGVVEAYQRRCAITGEKTLPVLEAAHIRPFASDGPHSVNNGLLLKSDFHTLFDDGYITVSPDLHIEVSKRLHDDYGNGKDYYRFHGQQLLIVPNQTILLPSKEFLQWHNEHIFLG